MDSSQTKLDVSGPNNAAIARPGGISHLDMLMGIPSTSLSHIDDIYGPSWSTIELNVGHVHELPCYYMSIVL